MSQNRDFPCMPGVASASHGNVLAMHGMAWHHL
jgi:hypothetical protein